MNTRDPMVEQMVNSICDLLVEMVNQGNGANLMRAIAIELRRRGHHIVAFQEDIEDFNAVTFIEIVKGNGGSN